MKQNHFTPLRILQNIAAKDITQILSDLLIREIWMTSNQGSSQQSKNWIKPAQNRPKSNLMLSTFKLILEKYG